MTEVLDDWEIKQELVVFLRNQDILTTTERNVTTGSATGSWSGATSHLIAATNVRNIRSITVDGSPLAYGTDYTADYTYNDSGTIKCKITLNSAQTGSYSISYDYGTDKIHPDFPQEHLSISSFPRIGVEVLNTPSRPGGLGNINESEVNFTVIVYHANSRTVEGLIKSIRTKFIANYDSFYYLGPIFPTGKGPLLPMPRDRTKDKVFQKSQDFRSIFNYEVNS